MKKDLKFIKETKWPEIFEGWKKRESHDPNWIKCATKIKGWSSWQSWRAADANRIKPKQRQWKIYEIVTPYKTIPEFLIGPTPTWQKMAEPLHWEDKNFKNLVEKIDFSENKKISEIIKRFPKETQFIGFYLNRINKIMCYEGHHRSTAIALGQKNGTPINTNKNPTIALTEFSEKDEALIFQMIKRGTYKKNYDSDR